MGEAVDLLSPVMGGKRLAQRMVRMLVRHGLLERCKPLTYRAVDLQEYLDREAAEYIASRLRRQGREATLEGRILRVEGACNDELKRLAENLGYTVYCSSSPSSS
ncbi:MAG: hypothetical protein GXO15_01140 [Crenarchaeota archaeon]|nr:hypothetical protein [Thermoproteota archaeon]